MEKSQHSGVAIKIEINLGVLRDVVSELKDALKAGGKSAEGTIKKAVDKISQMIQQAGEQVPEGKEAEQVFADAHQTLKEAAKAGSEDAKKVLKSFPKSGKSSSSSR